jgi:signal transduction histidine kinase
LASTLDLSTLLDRIVHASAELCGAEAGSILLYNELKQELYFEAATNMETPFMGGLVVPVDSSIAGWILTQRQPVILSEAHKDPRHFDRIGQATNLPTQSLLGVPLITKEKVIGVLEVINKQEGDFSDQDQELLTALGAQAAVAIENARLFQQSDLIAELVHELRTPLSSLNTGVHLLLRPEIDETQRRNILQTMHREIERLTELSSAFLQLARLESGRSQLHIQKVNLPELIDQCAELMAGKANEKCLSVEIRVTPGLESVPGDADQLKQVILNLLSNAIKYTPKGGKIWMGARAENQQAIFQIRDCGIGIPANSLAHIFEKFYRAPGSAQAAPGTGLGLSICQRIVEAHRGTITVESEPGEGSTFTVFLPAAGPQA